MLDKYVLSLVTLNTALLCLFAIQGLCLVEVLSGTVTFSNVAIHEEVFQRRSRGENPNIPV